MSEEVRMMSQEAPWPTELEELLEDFLYKPQWYFKLQEKDRGQGSVGLTLIITVLVPNSLKPDETIGVNHLFIVPAASYNYNSWMRWLLDRIEDVDKHERCEFFQIKGERIFAPHHSEGEDPYSIWYIGDAETANKRSGDK